MPLVVIRYKATFTNPEQPTVEAVYSQLGVPENSVWDDDDPDHERSLEELWEISTYWGNKYGDSDTWTVTCEEIPWDSR